MKSVLQMQAPIHALMVSKGFWDDKEARDRDEAVALIITEISEAIDAHRARKIFHYATMPDEMERQKLITFFNGPTDDAGIWVGYFKDVVKDTLEDELAGTMYRILDYCAGFGIQLSEHGSTTKSFRGSFAGNCLHLMDEIIFARRAEWNRESTSYVNLCWTNVYYHLLALADHYKVDLLRHLFWTHRYNETRPHKNGKAY